MKTDPLEIRKRRFALLDEFSDYIDIVIGDGAHIVKFKENTPEHAKKAYKEHQKLVSMYKLEPTR